MKNVLITREIPKEGLQELKKCCNVDMRKSVSNDELLEIAPYLDGVLCVGTKIDREFFERAKKIKIISNYGVGFDNVDIEAATRHKVPVTNLPYCVTESTAELTLALMLTLSRRILEADRFIRESNNYDWHPMLILGNELFDKKLGILGFGRIGKAVARRAKTFGMDIYYYDFIDQGNELATFLHLEDIYEDADYISLHLPYTKNTHHLINTDVFKKMKKSSFLINVARGPIVDETALIKALVNRDIAGAALDVFEREPFVPEELIKLPNVVLTPHIGTSTIETRIKMAKEASENILKVFRGEIPDNVVNREVFA